MSALLKCLFAALMVLALAAGPARPGQLLEAFGLPLMDGMTLDPGQSLLFDSPEGRVIEAVAHGPLSIPALTAFYRETLPMLGWQEQLSDNNEDSAALHFSRAGEKLEMRFNRLADGTRLRLTLAPE